MITNLSMLPPDTYRSFAEVPVVWLDLRIVYDKSHFTKDSAVKFLKTQIQDLADVFNKIKICFEIEYVAGTATEKADGLYYRIAEGAKDGIINAYLFYDRQANRDWSWFHSGSSQIFLRKSGYTETNTLGKESLSHEMAHLFGIRGSDVRSDVRILGEVGTWIVRKIQQGAEFIENSNSDIVLGTANLWCRNGYALYGRDWVDDYRNAAGFILGEPNEVVPRAPTILDLYRVAAKKIAAQAK